MIFCITNSFLVFWESSWKKLSICYKWYNNIKTQVHFPLHLWFYCLANFHFGMASYYVQKCCQQNCMRKGCVVWLVKETVQMAKLNFVLTCVFFWTRAWYFNSGTGSPFFAKVHYNSKTGSLLTVTHQHVVYRLSFYSAITKFLNS